MRKRCISAKRKSSKYDSRLVLRFKRINDGKWLRWAEETSVRALSSKERKNIFLKSPSGNVHKRFELRSRESREVLSKARGSNV
jgi:hypothetical protein